MKLLNFIILVFVSLGYCIGQIGYQLNFSRHTIVQKKIPSGTTPKADLIAYGGSFGSQYWTRLKNYRLEFIPGAQIGAAFNSDSDFKDYKVKDIYFLMDVPVLLYPMSFRDDCNCPTFKKTGNTMKKGFHLIGQLGLSINFRNINHDSVSISKTTLTPVIGAGCGLDLGINKYLTITPFVLYTVLFSDYLGRTDFDRIDISHHSLNAGIRLKIYKAKQRY